MKKVLILVLVMVEKSEKGFRFSHLKAINKKVLFCVGVYVFIIWRGLCCVERERERGINDFWRLRRNLVLRVLIGPTS